MKKITKLNIYLLVAVLSITAFSSTCLALSCGKFTYPKCDGADFQYADGFNPKAGFGGFGGGNCRANRTPVIFIHGNGDKAIGWDSPVSGSIKKFTLPANSVYDEFKARGYNDCELFGITYLDETERDNPKRNYHRPEKYNIIISFIEAVKTYTGSKQVDIVAHSLGVSMTLAALSYEDSLNNNQNAWGSVRRFVNIAGGLRGLDACRKVGFSNPLITTCGSQNVYNEYTFGFYPDTGMLMGHNQWTGSKDRLSLRRAPEYHPNVFFYTLHAGLYDQIHCKTYSRKNECSRGALFNKRPNVKAQLDVGIGSQTKQSDFDFSNWSPFVQMGGDVDGVGHFKARNNTAQIIFQMLNTDCAGISCRGAYTGGPAANSE